MSWGAWAAVVLGTVGWGILMSWAFGVIGGNGARRPGPRQRHLARVTAEVDDRTRPMGAAPFSDIVIHPEMDRYAAHKANALTEAIDPDPALGCLFCGPPFEATTYCTCASACGDRECGYLQWLQAGRGTA